MSAYGPRIKELEDEGRYLKTYEEWYKQAMEELLDSKLRPWVGGGSIHGCLVYATSCAVRGNLQTKSRFAAASTDFLTEQVKQNPSSSEAEEQYVKTSEQAALNWGMEAGHEHSRDALRRYFDPVEYSLPNTPDSASYEYKGRLNAKLKLATEMLSQKYN